MAAIPPKSDMYGLKHSAGDLIEAAFKRGVKYGRYLEQQEHIEAKKEAGPLEAERDALLAILKANLRYIDNTCELCAHYIECKGKDCPHYEEGVSDATICKPDGTVIGIHKDMAWNCMEWDSCRMRDGTPCESCDFKNHWEWRGVKEENHEKDGAEG